MTPAPPAPADINAALEHTWPAAALHRAGPWTLRQGRGGGKRVSAATADAPVVAADIALAETAMRALGQDPLFMIRDGETALDQALAEQGYRVIDPVAIYLAPVAALATPLPPLAAFAIWPPLAIARAIWAEAGIGPDRVAVMDRAAGAKTTILGRTSDHPAGVAFAAAHGPIAVLHALEVTPALRRQRTAANILHAAAAWAQRNGAAWLALAVTEANLPARNLYASLGMAIVGHYRYRQK